MGLTEGITSIIELNDLNFILKSELIYNVGFENI